MINEVKIYILDTNKLNDDMIFKKLYFTVSPYRQQKIMQYKFRKDKHLSLGAALLLDKGLKEYGLAEKNMKYSFRENKKPFFLEYPEIHFNISHSESTVICAFSENEVGCDIEKITKINFDIAQKYFLNSEAEYINSQKTITERENAFFRLWTLKESFMKITGLGMSLPLDSFQISFINNTAQILQHLDNKKYFFHEYDYKNSYKLSCCSHTDNFNKNLFFVDII